MTKNEARIARNERIIRIKQRIARELQQNLSESSSDEEMLEMIEFCYKCMSKAERDEYAK